MRIAHVNIEEDATTDYGCAVKRIRGAGHMERRVHGALCSEISISWDNK